MGRCNRGIETKFCARGEFLYCLIDFLAHKKNFNPRS